MQDTPGKLFLIPVTLGDISPLEVLPLSVRKVIEMVDHYIVENEKTARRAIKKILPSRQQSVLEFSVINKFTDASEIPAFLGPCLAGSNMGLMSEAGVPGVADPGAQVVALAHEKGIRVQPLVGPSSILMAMMSSGLNGQNFAFNGYLPIDGKERRRKIVDLEQRSRVEQQAQIFIETPYRNDKLLQDLVTTLNSNTMLCIACDLTLPQEFILTQPASQWKNHSIDLHKRPAIFIIQSVRY
jgi:16S rRNA (cytidine1402-2'-O)-methyltransferase